MHFSAPSPGAGDFYPRSPCGERLQQPLPQLGRQVFLSTLSLRRATVCQLQRRIGRKYFYPRSPCGERPFRHCTTYLNCSHFYPRSPCGERRKLHELTGQKLVFLSTLSLRRATTNHDQATKAHQISIHALLAESDVIMEATKVENQYFYPRSPCGERPDRPPAGYYSRAISIHALLAESDTSLVVIGTNCVISIHALLAESDVWTY